MSKTVFTGHGFLVLDKPAGITSAKAIQPLKKMCSGKVGHVGTLDPFATGMLVVSIGYATKFAGLQLKESKKYQACIQLGIQTDTQDITGVITDRKAVPACTDDNIRKILASDFTGNLMQKPSKYSALKYQGKPYHYYARQGIEIPIQARPITIHSIALEHYDHTKAQLSFSVTCSSGTYIRALAEDIAGKLGTCGMVKTLHRDFITPWSDAPLYSPNSCTAENLPKRIQNTDTVLQHFPKTTLTSPQLRKLQQGQTVTLPNQGTPTAILRVYDEKGQFAGLAESNGTILKAKKILPSDT